ncbi:hypothetical protein M153_2020700043 [Pseudoloma neurophilia]|uniref:J domain-containing protein n=1 Tax=Pseudoloma neurophilia TaxID=146866 RepID=A0A0R0LRJ2_9MICR|nr:hypothetical protein M153_2020700043 [Pseudoloma neurophilia]
MFNIFMIFLCLITAFRQRSDIDSAIDLLHKKTPFRTFYELFELNENSSISNIKKKFRFFINNKEILKNNLKDKMTDTELEAFITQSFNILTKQKKEYDDLLRSPFTLSKEPKNSLFSIILFFVSSIFLILLTDLIINFIRYQREKSQYENMTKKERKKLVVPRFTADRLVLLRFLMGSYEKLRNVGTKIGKIFVRK